MLTQFIETIHEEMDYTNESKNLKEIKKIWQKITKLSYPQSLMIFLQKMS
jgi:predicted unusual protein kinase regulating ubiquinone biosynthesis (AarF/ABC1/UbiB family)